MNFEAALKKHGLTMPKPQPVGGVYKALKEFGPNFCYLSGSTPTVNGEDRWVGRVGKEVSIEEAQKAARTCSLNLMANIIAKYGDLDKVKRIVKMIAFIVPAENFFDLSKVSNAASELFVDVFGEEAGMCARSTIGVYALPRNAPVEVEILIELK